MKNRSNRLAYARRKAELKKIMENPKKFEEKVGTEITEDDVIIVHEITREARLEEFIKNLDIDCDQYEQTKKRIITLHPKSQEFPLISTLYRNHKGKYKVEDLINEYHDSILKEGLEIGMDYGKKFIIEDIQNKRFTKKDILNMTKTEITEYCDEIRDEI